jgi:hypothetical protein
VFILVTQYNVDWNSQTGHIIHCVGSHSCSTAPHPPIWTLDGFSVS